MATKRELILTLIGSLFLVIVFGVASLGIKKAEPLPYGGWMERDR